jgi:CheY-like chemotaxis protein
MPTRQNTLIDGDEIASITFRPWERAGRPLGRDLEFWTSAEEGVIARIRRKVTPRSFRNRALKCLSSPTTHSSAEPIGLVQSRSTATNNPHEENDRRKTKEPVTRPDHAQPANRILVVDDDFFIRDFMAAMLTTFGYQVDTAEDGIIGWEALQASSYDLLITDNDMPRVSGIELVKVLRVARMTLPVMLVSGNIPNEALNRNPSLKLAATLAKPFTIGDLLGTVKKVLTAAQSAAAVLPSL